MKNIAIIITSHNRLFKTRRCLLSILKLKNKYNIKINIYLTNDGCTDGTKEYIKKKLPKVKIFDGSGNLYWARGMRFAWSKVRKKYDYYLWLNDDVYLYNDFLKHFLKDIQSINKKIDGNKFIISYPTFCNLTNRKSTGGLKIIDNMFNYNFKSIKKKNKLIECDTFNGNCVLIPNKVFKIVGNIDQKFSHRFADHDYGLMSKKKGIKIYTSKNYCGICNLDKKKKYKIDDYKEWMYFLKKHSNFWPIHITKFLLKRLLKKWIK